MGDEIWTPEEVDEQQGTRRSISRALEYEQQRDDIRLNPYGGDVALLQKKDPNEVHDI